MKILLYGINYKPELTGIGKYSGEMAQWLSQNKYDVRVITAPPYYPNWKVFDGYSNRRYSSKRENEVRVIRCPLYIPKKLNTFKRVLHLSSFSLSSFFPILKQLFWKPDLVILVVPTLFCAPSALLLARLSGAKAMIHIQDYEVDAMFGLGLAQEGRLKIFSSFIEKKILQAFDCVSSISTAMLNRAKVKGVSKEKLLFFPNWSEISRFKGIHRSEQLLRSLGVDPKRKILLYSGNIGEKQGLEIVIEAAERVKDSKDVQFLIVGEGAGKSRLLEARNQLKLDNVIFAPLQPYELLPVLLASADVHLVIQKKGIADAVLPSKLTNILAVGGNAVITAEETTSLGALSIDYPGIVTLVAPESVEALLNGIEQALEMPVPNHVATDYAEKFLDKENVLKKFMKEVSDVVER